MIPRMRPIDLQPRDLLRRREAGENPVLVDCREQWEYDLTHLAGAVLMPLSTMNEDSAEDLPAGDVVVYCHHGIRSRTAAAILRHGGISSAQSLAGGIDRWSVEIDPTVARY